MTILPEPWETFFLTFFFIYVRVSVMIFVMPILSNETVISPVRAGIAFFVSVVICGPLLGLHEPVEGGMVAPNVVEDYFGLMDFAMAVIAEAAIGFLLGFIGQMLIQTIGLSGEIIGQQAGFSASSVFDPITGQDIMLVAQIKSLFGTMIFMAVGGIETSLEVLAYSFQVLSPGGGLSFADYAYTGYHILIFNESQQHAMTLILYKVGLQIAAPIVAVMFLVSLAEAFIARVSPQLNILAVGFAIRIGISLIVFIYSWSTTMQAFRDLLLQYPTYAGAALDWLSR